MSPHAAGAGRCHTISASQSSDERPADLHTSKRGEDADDHTQPCCEFDQLAVICWCDGRTDRKCRRRWGNVGHVVNVLTINEL